MVGLIILGRGLVFTVVWGIEREPVLIKMPPMILLKEFVEFVETGGFGPQQVFNCDETGPFWKKMPNRTYVTQEEMALAGHKPMKDRLTLLFCGNASGDCKLKPLLIHHSENPRAFKKHEVQKTPLSVMWRSNSKAWVTREYFSEWFNVVFGPSVKSCLEEKNLPSS
jgi:hypothetical protein